MRDEVRLLLARHRPGFRRAAQGPVEGHYDVAVIGGGFTGLAAARQLAKAGRQGRRAGGGARRLGRIRAAMAGTSTTASPTAILAAKAELGKERAIALYRALDDSDRHDRGDDCRGRHRLQFPPRRQAQACLQAAAFRCDRPQLRSDSRGGRSGHGIAVGGRSQDREIGSPFHGAMLSKKSAMMHMGRYVGRLGHGRRPPRCRRSSRTRR